MDAKDIHYQLTIADVIISIALFGLALGRTPKLLEKAVEHRLQPGIVRLKANHHLPSCCLCSQSWCFSPWSNSLC